MPGGGWASVGMSAPAPSASSSGWGSVPSATGDILLPRGLLGRGAGEGAAGTSASGSDGATASTGSETSPSIAGAGAGAGSGAEEEEDDGAAGANLPMASLRRRDLPFGGAGLDTLPPSGVAFLEALPGAWGGLDAVVGAGAGALGVPGPPPFTASGVMGFGLPPIRLKPGRGGGVTDALGPGSGT